MTRRRTTRFAVLCVLAVLPLSSCGSAADEGTANRPSVTGTPSPTRLPPSLSRSPDVPETTEAQPSPSRSRSRSPGTNRPSPTARPTRTPEPESQQPTPRTSTVIAVPVPAATSAAPSPSPTPSPAAEEAAAPDSPSPAAWVAFALLVVAAALGVIFLLVGHKRRSWLAALETATAEVSWFARELVPQLRSSGSIDEVAGGWRVAMPRVAAAEDRLTVLASSAPDEDAARQARRLRDAVRSASERLERLAGPGRHDEWALDLDDVEALLMGVLEPAPRAARGAG